MLKNLFLLGLLTWVSFSFAKYPVAQDNITGAESYKVENPHKYQPVKRSLAGSKIKKAKPEEKNDGFQKSGQDTSSEPDSEVRYWQYSE